MPEQPVYNFSFRCFFPTEEGSEEPNFSSHYQRLALSDLPRWIDSYKFTHPNCQSLTCKMWFVDNGIEFPSL